MIALDNALEDLGHRHSGALKFVDMTHAASQFGKRLQNFWDAAGTEEYKEALAYAISNSLNSSEFTQELVETQRGRTGGTWAHPKLAVFFARWLDVKFAVFCDMVIGDLTHGYSVLKV